MSSTEIVLPAQDIPREIQRYGQVLSGFAYHKQFPEHLLGEPDYAMIKEPVPTDFQERVAGIRTWAAEQPIFTEVDWRFVVMAHLAVPVKFMEWRQLENVEVMEAKSPDGTADYLGVEYVSFHFQNLTSATEVLQRKKIDYQMRGDGYSRWINVPINNEGQEIHISDKLLSDTLEQRLEAGSARYI